MSTTLAMFPYIKRTFVLYDLNRPPGMLPRGIRNHILTSMKGRLIAGSIRGVKAIDEFGHQCIVIKATALESDLELFEDQVLKLKDKYFDSFLWKYSKTYVEDQRFAALTDFTFNITQSGYGFIKGDDSDEIGDNKSEKSKSASSKSQKSQSNSSRIKSATPK